MIQNKFKSSIKCPHCKSTNLYLREWLEATTQFNQTDGIIDVTESNNEPGNTFKVTAECKDCGHEWRIRNIVSMAGIIPI